MKRILSTAAICSLILTVSCNKENGTGVEHDFQYKAPAVAMATSPVKFTDNSLDVASRTWTFENAEPATSDKAVVDVTFNKTGNNKAKLVVKFNDGGTETAEFEVKTVELMKADIKAEGLTPKGCAKLGHQVQFSLENVVGSPASYKWIFPGGIPESTTEETPVVTWNKQDDEVVVICEMTHSESEELVVEVTREIVAGNYPLLKKDKKYGYDVFGFEGTNDDVRDVWITSASDGDQYGSDAIYNKAVIVDGGSDSEPSPESKKSLKIDASSYLYMPIKEYASMHGFIDIFHRLNWSNNAFMEVGKKYKMSFDIKADATKMEDVEILKAAPSFGQLNKGELGAVMEIAWIYACTTPAGVNDPLRNINSATNWKNVFGEDYVSQTSGDLTMHEFRYTRLDATQADYSDLHFVNLIKGEWQTLSDEFTLKVAGYEDGTVFKNCFICVRLNGYGATFWLDNFRIDEIE